MTDVSSRPSTTFVDEHIVGLGAVAVVIVLVVVVFVLFGPVVEQTYSHCSETPPPDSGITCMNYMPALED